MEMQRLYEYGSDLGGWSDGFAELIPTNKQEAWIRAYFDAEYRNLPFRNFGGTQIFVTPDSTPLSSEDDGRCGLVGVSPAYTGSYVVEEGDFPTVFLQAGGYLLTPTAEEVWSELEMDDRPATCLVFSAHCEFESFEGGWREPTTVEGCLVLWNGKVYSAS